MLNVAITSPQPQNDHTLCHMDNNKQWTSCNGLNWFSYIYTGLSKTLTVDQQKSLLLGCRQTQKPLWILL